MPDLLGVTNAVPGNDANLINRNMPSIPNDPRVQNATDLNRVSRPDNRAERQDAGETGSQAARYDSNFITFLQRMSETPGLARTMAELRAVGGVGDAKASRYGKAFLEEIGAFPDRQP